jgi:DNA polymerase III subunit gamma/tau
MPSVDWEYQDVLIDPYLLGLLITDGSFSKGNFGITNSEQDILLNVNKILKENYNMYLRHSSKYDYRIQYIDNPNHCGSRGDRGRHSLIRNYNYTDTLKGQLDFYRLLTKSVNKHIPKEYLLNNKDMRIKLLQGLFDGDGTIEKNGSPVFSTSSKQLSDDFAFLVRSLGIRDTITEKESFFNGKQHSNNYSHYLHVPNNLRFYNSKKHEGRAKERQNGQIRNIAGIEYIGKEECQCIMVDHVDHTYISDDFIPTHNTTIARIMAREIKGQVLEIDAASNNGVDDVRNIIIDAKSKPFAHDYKVYIIDEVHMLSNAAFNAMLKILEEPPSYVIFIMCTTEPNKIIPTVRSRSQHFNFKRVDKELIKGRLETINPNLEENVYDYIAELSEGGVRDAITLLDTCMQYKSIFSIDDAQNILGIVNDEIIEELLINIYDDKNRTLKIINDVYIVGTDMKKFLRDILNFIVRRQKKEVLEGIESYDSINLDVIFEEVYKLYNEIKYEDNPKILIEGVFLCMDRKE